MWPSEEIQTLARERAAVSGARVTITDDVEQGIVGAQFVHTDVWVSMGEPADVWAERIAALTPYRVDRALMALTGRDDARFMHCLPAHRGEEVSAEVIDGPQSVVWDEAENRLHVQKALLEYLVLGKL